MKKPCRKCGQKAVVPYGKKFPYRKGKGRIAFCVSCGYAETRVVSG